MFILSLNRAEQFGVLLQNHLHDYDGPIVCVLNNVYDSESRALQVCAIAQRSHRFRSARTARPAVGSDQDARQCMFCLHAHAQPQLPNCNGAF